MNISKYEAVSFYDYTNNHVNGDFLVIDLDDCSFGFCNCNTQGEICLNCSDGLQDHCNLWELCIDSIKAIVDENNTTNFIHEVETQLIANGNVMQGYILSDKMMDLELLHISNQVIVCSEFEKCIRHVKLKIEELLNIVKKQVNISSIENSYVIILGRAQDVFLVDYYIREGLSGDPLLPDDRFRNTEYKDSYNEIVRIGTELWNANKSIHHTYSLLLFSRETNTVEKILIAKKGQPQDALTTINYTEPLLLERDDVLSMEIDDKIVDIELPYSFAPMDSDLVQVALGLENNKEQLYVRRTRFPTQVYSLAYK